MAEIKVKEIGPEEEKGTQQVEAELLAKHESQQENVEAETAPVEIEATTEAPAEANKEIDDDSVLSYIKNRYNKDITSVDELFETTNGNEELPEDVATFLKYKQDTGRGIDDFVKLNRNFDNESPDAIIAEYISTQNPEFDRDDVSFEMSRNFSFDEDEDEEVEIRSKKIAKKKMLAEARRFFNDQKEKYKAPLESRDGFIPNEDKELFEQYKQSTKQQEANKEDITKRSEHFSKKTNELFSKNFDGFGYEVGEEKVTFKVNDVDKVKDVQSDAMNFINKHLDENGLLKDANAYHKALNAAMDPDALFKFAYEKGAADAITKDAKEAKNVDMKAKSTQQKVSEPQKYRVVNPGSGNRLVIKSKNK